MNSRKKLNEVIKRRKANAEADLEARVEALANVGVQVRQVKSGSRLQYVGITGKIHTLECWGDHVVLYNGTAYAVVVQEPKYQLYMPVATTLLGGVTLAERMFL